jgi:hypothetical protein
MLAMCECSPCANEKRVLARKGLVLEIKKTGSGKKQVLVKGFWHQHWFSCGG